MSTATPNPCPVESSSSSSRIYRKSLYLIAGICFLVLGCAPKAGTGSFSCGEFSFSYPTEQFGITDSSEEDGLTKVIVYRNEKPFNRLELNIYRYEPEMAASILPSDLEGELNLDVGTVAGRIAEGLEVTDESGLLLTGRPGRTYEVCKAMYVRDSSGTQAIVTVTSTQVAHYNIIAVAWGETEDVIGGFAGIFDSFRVNEP